MFPLISQCNHLDPPTELASYMDKNTLYTVKKTCCMFLKVDPLGVTIITNQIDDERR